MKKSSLILIVFSSIFGLFLAEFTAKLIISNGSHPAFCWHVEQSPFATSRGYSLEHAHYQPLSSVAHCSEEFSYTYNINSMGFRKSALPIREPSILAIGDSFTFGFGVKDDETFPALIGAYNAGMWGNPFDIQFRAFQRNVFLVKPKIVVWGIYPPHVITMMPGEWQTNIPGDKTIFTPENKISELIIRSIPWTSIGESYLVKLAYKSLSIKSISFDSNKLVLRRDGYQTTAAILFDKNLGKTEYTDSDSVNESFNKELNSVLQQMTEYFSRAKEISDMQGFRIIFVLIPSRLNLRLYDADVSITNYKNADFDPSLPSRLMSQTIIDAGFSESDIFDLGVLPDFRQGRWAEYYFKIDAHWNDEGHKLVARFLQERLGLHKEHSN